MGRPRSGTLGSFAPEIKVAIDNRRPGKEGWGAVTIKAELRLDPALSALDVPCVRSINYYLKETQKVRSYRKAEKLPEEPVFASRHAHDVWQMDAEGNKVVQGVGTVSTINIKDIFSKVHICSYPCALPGNFNHPNRGNYQWALRLGMLEFGRCCRLQVDHDSIYYENTHNTPYPTPFHLWALGIGISLSFTPKAKPYKQGAVERQHQTLHGQTCAGRTFENWDALFAFSQERLRALNHYIPSRALNGKAPLEVFPEANHNQQLYDPKQEETYFDSARICEYLTDGRWIRTVNAQRKFSLGKQFYSLEKATPNSSVVITMDSTSELFKCCTPEGEVIETVQPKGISFKELCGNLEAFIAWVEKTSQVNFKTKW